MSPDKNDVQEGPMTYLCSGKYRDVSFYDIDRGNLRVYKEERPMTEVHVARLPGIGSIDVQYPSWMRREFSLIYDLCDHDGREYEKLEPVIRDHGMEEFFLRVLAVNVGGNLMGASQPLVEDYNGRVSRNLAEAGRPAGIGDGNFWLSMEKIVQFMYANGIELNLEPANILARKTSSQAKFAPVLFDYKQVGPRNWFVRPRAGNGWRSDKVLLRLKRRYE